MLLGVLKGDAEAPLKVSPGCVEVAVGIVLWTVTVGNVFPVLFHQRPPSFDVQMFRFGEFGERLESADARQCRRIVDVIGQHFVVCPFYVADCWPAVLVALDCPVHASMSVPSRGNWFRMVHVGVNNASSGL